MGRIVTIEDIDPTSARTVSVSTSSVEISPSRLSRTRRRQIVITNISATTVTVTRGDAAAVANVGIRLLQNQSWIESDDGGYECYQGAYQAIASAASSVVVSELNEL